MVEQFGQADIHKTMLATVVVNFTRPGSASTGPTPHVVNPAAQGSGKGERDDHKEFQQGDKV
jgi:hypothetical protein